MEVFGCVFLRAYKEFCVSHSLITILAYVATSE